MACCSPGNELQQALSIFLALLAFGGCAATTGRDVCGREPCEAFSADSVSLLQPWQGHALIYGASIAVSGADAAPSRAYAMPRVLLAILALAVQYFAVHTILSVTRCYNKLRYGRACLDEKVTVHEDSLRLVLPKIKVIQADAHPDDAHSDDARSDSALQIGTTVEILGSQDDASQDDPVHGMSTQLGVIIGIREESRHYIVRLEGGSLERLIASASEPIGFSPMLCTLFLTPWVKAIRLTGSLDPTSASLPPYWLGHLTILCSCVLIAKTVLHILLGCSELGRGPMEGNTEAEALGRILKSSKVDRLVSFVMYFSVAGVVLGTVYMPTPSITDLDASAIRRGGPQGMSIATICTLILGAQYFAFTLLFQAMRSMDDRAGKDHESGWMSSINFHNLSITPLNLIGPAEQTSMAIFNTADILRMVPMLCLLFQAAGLRAVELSPPAGELPYEVQAVMAISAFALFSCPVLLMTSTSEEPTLDRGKGLRQKKFLSLSTKSVVEQFLPTSVSSLLDFVKVALVLFVFGAAGCVCYVALWGTKVEDTHGNRIDALLKLGHGVRPSTSIFLVVLVATLFFLVHVPDFVAKQMATSTNLIRCLDIAREAVVLCPMVSVLIVTLQFRSLQCTGEFPIQQPWLKVCMFAALIGLAGRLLAGLCGALPPRVAQSVLPEESETLRDKELSDTVGAWPLQLASTLLVGTCTMAMVVGCFWI